MTYPKMSAVMDQINERLAGLEKAAQSEMALKRYQAGAPMSTADVAVVLGISRSGVLKAVQRGRLFRRGFGLRPFHPSDIQDYCWGVDDYEALTDRPDPVPVSNRPERLPETAAEVASVAHVGD